MVCREIGASQKPECPTARPQACPCNMKKPVTWMSIPAAKKVKHHGSVRAEGVKGASADFVCFHCPLVAPAGAIPPATKNTTPLAGESCCINKSTALLERPAVWSRSCARQYEAGRKSYLGAHLRMRKVTGKDASLPAPLLTFPLEWSPVEQLGRCPKPHKGAPPLDPARGNFPLDPSARLSWSLLLTSSACCSFVLRLRPFSALIIT